MDDVSPVTLTPEQVAAVDAASGAIYAHDPASNRRFLLVEQPTTEGDSKRLTVDELRVMIDEALAESERGECRPWDAGEIKEGLRRRFADRGIT